MQLWFLDTLVDIPVTHDDGADGMSVKVSRARRGDSPPYHVHATEDEVFHVLDGELVAMVDGSLRRLRAGESALLPKRVPHTYCVVSEEARWLLVTTHGDFERFVRDVARPAEGDALPAESGPPTPEQQAALAEVARRHGIELVGPPLSVETAAAA
jgi:quercetin dioxygenase-like cupin family protein